MNPLPLIISLLMTVYGAANIVFAFLNAPAWLERRLGPDRRTRRMLGFLPEPSMQTTGRIVYGVVILVFAGMMVWFATL